MELQEKKDGPFRAACKARCDHAQRLPPRFAPLAQNFESPRIRFGHTSEKVAVFNP